MIGTTSCGPAMEEISGSTFAVVDLEGRAFGHQVTDFREKSLVGHEISRPAVFPVPCVDLRLQRVTLGKQRPVFARHIVNDSRKSLPESLFGQTRSRQDVLVDEFMEFGCDLEARDFNPFHGGDFSRFQYPTILIASITQPSLFQAALLSAHPLR